ncbi:MAG: NAD(P)/FAD-dependent oxidoreductase [Acidimicrobiales bacterium]
MFPHDPEEPSMYDAIVIGSRCAGAPTAMLLARAGRRVLVVDRATFPSDVLSGHTIQPAGVARLERWGLLDQVRATGVPFTSKVRFDFGPVVLEGEPVPVDGITDAVCIRRTIIDSLLTSAAADAGAEVRQGFAVKSLLWEGDRVVGIRGRDATGAIVEERAHIVIGADGVSSFVARAAGATTYDEVPATTVNVYSYWRGLDLDALELYVRPNRFFVATPTNDGLAFVNQSVPVGEADRYRGRTADAFAETVAEVPHLAGRLARAERVERFRWAPPGDAFFRIPSGPGWALVGDAGYHLDPITAQGMLDAFRDAELLAGAVDRGLGDGTLSEELLGYQRDRDTAALPMYRHTANLADVSAPPPPEMLELIGALAGNPRQTSRFFGLIAGSVAVPEFFSPDIVATILAEAAGPATTPADAPAA